MSTKKPIAAFVTDIHLSTTAPIARSNEKDWMLRQEFYLKQWSDLKSKHNIPGFIGGDIFDKHKGSPELIVMAMRHLKGDYSVAGQHDLPYHDYNEVGKSAYGVLVESGTIEDINGTHIGIGMHTDCYFRVYGFGWNNPITTLKKTKGCLHVALAHAYCWKKEDSYVGADKAQNVVAYKKKLRGYDAAVFGDNHKGFITKSGDCVVVNNGGFMRRKSDEIEYQPCMALLFSDGSMERVPVKCSGDVFVDPQALKRMIGEVEGLDMEGFVEELQKLGDTGLDYRFALRAYMDKKGVSKSVRKLLTSITENE